MMLRRATPDDAPLLASHRAAIWNEIGEWSREELAPAIPDWIAFIRRATADSTYVAYIAEQDGAVVGSGALLLQLAFPRPGFDSDRAGRMHSVYVAPEARRRGIALAIVNALLAFAREARLIEVSLHPSEVARPLYASLGFTQADEMRFRLSPS